MRILGERILHQQKWTLVKEKMFLNNHGEKGTWTYIERRGRQKAAIIVPVTKGSGALVMIHQFRVPFEQSVYEFPAGLIDEGEKIEEAAVRELREETGYTGRILEIGPEIVSTSGLSTETVHMVYMEVDEEPRFHPEPEGSEQIDVIKLPKRDFLSFLTNGTDEKYLIDAKLYLYVKEHCS